MSILDDRIKILWMDGKWLSPTDAKVSVLTHTLHYGLGVFEGVRAYETDEGTAIFRLQAHTERLFRSAKAVNMTIPVSMETLLDVQQAVLRKNHFKSAYIRPLIFYGSEHLGLQTGPLTVHVMIAAWEWGEYFSVDQRSQGIKACLSSYCRQDARSVPCKAKACGLYVNSILSLQEAQQRGCQEALLLDTEGMVAEGSSANLFLVKDGELYTPNSPHVLDGITRDSLCTLALQMGLHVYQQPLTLLDVEEADEMFFSGTAVEIAPVSEFEGKKVGSGQIGPITNKLYTQFHQLTLGKLDDFRDWLTWI